jgi:hypothetical protein
LPVATWSFPRAAMSLSLLPPTEEKLMHKTLLTTSAQLNVAGDEPYTKLVSAILIDMLMMLPLKPSRRNL